MAQWFFFVDIATFLQRIRIRAMTDALASFASFASLADWQHAAPAEPPTANMMMWMAHFEEPCPLLCCRATDCASIQCLFCQKSLTSATGVRPALRFECAECTPVGCESFTLRSTAIVSATTMCAVCFSDASAAPHRHSARFLRIDDAGRHSECIRPLPPAPVRELVLADFAPAHDVQGQCQCCGDDFSAELPAVYPAFCRKSHGIACSRDASGKSVEPFDTGTFYCGGCALQCAVAKGLRFYDWCDVHCSLCLHDREMSRWRTEFELERLGADRDGAREERARLLRDAHKQPWIRALVDEVFDA